MRWAACAVLSLWLVACEPASLPGPSIVSVVPEQVVQGSSSALSVRVNAVLPLSVDYETRSVDPTQLELTVQVAGQAVDIPFAKADGTLVVPVPEGLPLGAYEIRVVLADGREVVRERAFSVVPPATLGGTPRDGGTPGDGGLDNPWGNIQADQRGFEFDPIDGQVRHVPFKVILRVTGPDARSFQEPVKLRASKGELVSATQGTFVEGVQTEEISLSLPNPHVYLLVEDAQGHKGLSNPFRVRPN